MNNNKFKIVADNKNECYILLEKKAIITEDGQEDAVVAEIYDIKAFLDHSIVISSSVVKKVCNDILSFINENMPEEAITKIKKFCDNLK